MTENKKPVGPSATSTTGSRPSMPKKGEAEDLMGNPPDDMHNPESAPGGDIVGEPGAQGDPRTRRDTPEPRAAKKDD